uniref:Calmodulin-binding domain-containing protein n=1 Tax=Anthurium amnicola TaxID=1678845 RepID=A0A1D1ZGS1_9ARAE
MNEEAREVAFLPLTPRTTNEEYVMTDSTGKSATEVSLSLSKNEGNVLSRYLRSSMGSCHDFCKYGRSHKFESMGKQPTFRRFSGGNANFEKDQNRGSIPSLAGSRKKSIVKQKASAHRETGFLNRTKLHKEKSLTPVHAVKSSDEFDIVMQNSLHFLENNGLPQESVIVECDVPSPSKKIDSLEGFEIIKQVNAESIELYESPETLNRKASSLLSKASGDAETGNQGKPSVKKANSFLEPTSMKQRTHSAKKAFASTQTKIKEKVSPPIKKTIPSPKHKVSKVEASSPAKRSNASEKPGPSSKSMIQALKPASALNHTKGTAGRKSESKIAKNLDVQKSDEKKALKPSSVSLYSKASLNQFANLTMRKYKNIKSASPVKHAKKVGKFELESNEVTVKTLHIIKPRPAEKGNLKSAQLKDSSCRPSLSSSLPSLSSPLSSPSVSDHEEEQPQNCGSPLSKACDSVSAYAGERVGEVLKKENNKIHRRAATVRLEGKEPTPHKVKFRRGKIVNPQSDNNAPRRLRFRQGKRLDDNQSGKGEASKQSFSRKELACGDLDHSTPEAQVVVLRHQDVHGKKDAQGLFNCVIEETASKLVESRKSKVKALVGAFETVISLQERKPAASV